MIAKRAHCGNDSATDFQRRFNYLPTVLDRLKDLTGMVVDALRGKPSSYKCTTPPLKSTDSVQSTDRMSHNP
jgi:hypothetical protein